MDEQKITERNVYAIEFAVRKVAEGSNDAEIGKLVNIGIEGINIVDAIMGLNLVLPDGTEYEVFSAKLEQVIQQGADGVIIQQENEPKLQPADEHGWSVMEDRNDV